jgi:hypothetical protein
VPAEVIEQLTHNWRKQSEALARSEKDNRLLRELLRLMRVEKYGPASERLSDEQLELLEQEPGASEAEVEAESKRAQLQLPLKGSKLRPGGRVYRPTCCGLSSSLTTKPTYRNIAGQQEW